MLRNNQSLLTKIVNSIINSYLILNLDATLGEFVLNFIKFDTQTNKLANEIPNNKVYVYLIVKYFLPIIYEIIQIILKKFNFSKTIHRLEIINKIINFLNLILEYYYKFKYIFLQEFTYFSFFDYIFQYMTINKGSTGSFKDKFLNIGKQLNLFLLFIFIRLGEWYYSKDSSENTSIEIEPPTVEKTIKKTLSPGVKIGNPKETLFNNGKCFICNNKPNNYEILVLICCGLMFCEKCYKNKREKIQKNTFCSEDFKCPLCDKKIIDTSFVKVYP
jgi:hypothetical protein